MLNLKDSNGVFDLLRSGGFGSNVTTKQLKATIIIVQKYENRINRGTNYDVRMYKLYKIKRLNAGLAHPLLD